MARPTRTFTGQEGQRATGSAGPDPIRRDFDAIFAMFNPEATLPTGEAGGIDASENMKAVQVDQNQAPEADAGKIPTLLSGIVNRIKAITGMPDWKNTPPTTLAGVHNQVNNITVDQSKRPESDTGNIQQLLSWIVNRLKAITGRDDWKEDPGVSLQDITDKASHDDISFHSLAKSGVHGVGQQYVAKTSRSDQWPSWNDIPDKPSTFPVGPHQHSAQDIITGTFDVARIPNLPASKVTSGQFDAARIPNLPASKITSGTFDAARLPKASTSQAGIVQLTNSRSSTSETLAVTAKALNDHRNSADHDGRYYTKAQVDSLIQTQTHATRFQVSGNIQEIYVPSNSSVILQLLDIIVPAGKRLVLKRARYWLGTASGIYLHVTNTSITPTRSWDSPSAHGESVANAVIIDNSGGSASVTDTLRVFVRSSLGRGQGLLGSGWWLDLSIE